MNEFSLFAFRTCRGIRRKISQDRLLMMCNVREQGDLFGLVVDGHGPGGERCAELVVHLFALHFPRLTIVDDVSVRELCLAIDREVCAFLMAKKLTRAGAVATGYYLSHSCSLVFSVGDTEAWLVRSDRELEKLTIPHSTSESSERIRLLELGFSVIDRDGEGTFYFTFPRAYRERFPLWCQDGGLMVGRAFGQPLLKPAYDAIPAVFCCERLSGNALFIATDGVRHATGRQWEMRTNKLGCEILLLEDRATFLWDGVAERNSDDATAIAVDLELFYARLGASP